MRTITDNNTKHVKVLGRDVFEGTSKKTVDGVQLTQYPLIWFEAQKKGSGIAFGPGISYATGEKPTGSDLIFAAGQRISLVETILPITTRRIIPVDDPLEIYESVVFITVSEVTRTAEITPIPFPYVSTAGAIRNPEDSIPCTLVTVLGYRDPVRGLAIAEKVEYLSLNEPLFTDTAFINRYPYLVTRIVNDPETGLPAYEQGAVEYYYTEKELEDAIEKLANESE